jgi:hypothetical protein
MATISYVTPEEHAAALQRIDRLEKLLEAYVTSNPEWLTTAQALKVAGIQTRETLSKYYRASSPNKQEVGRITYCKDGRRCFYLRSSCVDHRLRKLGQPALHK